jgi:transcriptional regulator with XRE-family HTH domain
MATQIERIDIALSQVGKTRHDLANELGIARQAIYRLTRREGSSLTAEHLAKASKVMRCDLYWLCTGEGGHYVPAPPEPGLSFLAAECARLMDQMNEADQARAFVLVYEASKGHWPTMTNVTVPCPGTKR